MLFSLLHYMLSLTALMGFLLFSGAASLHAGPSAAQTPPSAPEKIPVPTYTVTVTAYNAVPEQTDDTPHETASGAFSNTELIAARSRDLAQELPFGTIIAFDASGAVAQKSCGFRVVEPVVGYRVIADTMNARYTDRIDILFSTKREYIADDGSSKNAAEVLGICGGVTVRAVGFIDIGKMPGTQDELAALVDGARGNLALK